MNEIRFTYLRTKEDLLRFSVWHGMIKTPYFFMMNFILPLVAIWAVIQVIVYEYPMESLLLILAIYIILFPVINYVMIRVRVSAVLKRPDMKFETVTYTFSESGITVESLQGSASIKWDELYQIYNLKHYMYFYVNRENPLIINKVELGAENSEILKELIRNNAPVRIVKRR